MNDTLQRIISRSGKIFGIACNTTALVTEACRRHDLGPTAAAALARALTGSVLLAGLLKDQQSIQLIFEGNGPLGKVVADAGNSGWARGYVTSPHADLPLKDGMIDVAGGIGRAGFLRVIKNIGTGKNYTGLTQLYTSEIGEDIAYYLTESEQTPSVVNIGAHFQPDGTVIAAGGFLIQTLPPAEKEALDALEKGFTELGPVTEHLRAGKTPSEILARIFNDVSHKNTGSIDLQFQCSCSRGKMEKALHSLNNDDLDYLINNKDEVDVKCDFCSDRFVFGKKDIILLMEHRKQS